MGDNQFGYVEIKDDRIISYTGASEDPEIHKFENSDIVNAVQLCEVLTHMAETTKKEQEAHFQKMKDWHAEQQKLPEDQRDKTVPMKHFSDYPKTAIEFEDIIKIIKGNKQRLLDVYN